MGALCSKREPKKRNEYQELNKQNPDAGAQVITFAAEQAEVQGGSRGPPPPTPTPTPTPAPKDTTADPTPVDAPADPSHKTGLAALAEEMEGEDEGMPYQLALTAYTLFRKMDKDNSGDIDLSEIFRSYLEGRIGGKGLTQEDAKFIGLSDTPNKDRWVRSVDADGNGIITFPEFLAFLCKRKASDPKEGDTPSISFKIVCVAHDFFRKVDGDNDGRISHEEITSMSAEDKMALGVNDVNTWLDAANRSGGSLKWDGFLELCQR